jgi:hypothetical protein
MTVEGKERTQFPSPDAAGHPLTRGEECLHSKAVVMFDTPSEFQEHYAAHSA